MTKLATFADSFPPQMEGKVNQLATDLVQGAEDAIAKALNEPQGSTGGLRSSRTLESVSGGGLRLGWTDRAAIGIDVGRIASQPISRKTKRGGKSKTFTRLLGSAQAPQGFTQPAISALRAGWDQVATAAGKAF